MLPGMCHIPGHRAATVARHIQCRSRNRATRPKMIAGCAVTQIIAGCDRDRARAGATVGAAADSSRRDSNRKCRPRVRCHEASATDSSWHPIHDRWHGCSLNELESEDHGSIRRAGPDLGSEFRTGPANHGLGQGPSHWQLPPTRNPSKFVRPGPVRSTCPGAGRRPTVVSSRSGQPVTEAGRPGWD